MTESSVQPRSATLDAIVTAFADLDPRPDGPVVVARYFRHVPDEELRARPPQTLAGAVKSHLELAQTRVLGEAAVRVFNPTTDTDGWSSARTVIQVVTDDMPFLVDSVTGALVQSDVDIHLVVHPQLRVRREPVHRQVTAEPASVPGGVAPRPPVLHISEHIRARVPVGEQVVTGVSVEHGTTKVSVLEAGQFSEKTCGSPPRA